MRHYLLALAAASLAFTATGHAGMSYADGYYGHSQQTCITRRMQTHDQRGRAITKRVRICQQRADRPDALRSFLLQAHGGWAKVSTERRVFVSSAAVGGNRI